MHYLRAIRLGGVREDLTNARGRDLRVSDVAMKWGFKHFGRFALAYRDFFGALPSTDVNAASAPCKPPSVNNQMHYREGETRPCSHEPSDK